MGGVDIQQPARTVDATSRRAAQSPRVERRARPFERRSLPRVGSLGLASRFVVLSLMGVFVCYGVFSLVETHRRV